MITTLKIVPAPLLMLLLFACAIPGDSPDGAGSDATLTILYWQAPSIPFPYLSVGSKDVDAGAVTLEPLAGYDPYGKLTPRLAAEIPTAENGGIAADLTSITWRLKPELLWSDGSALTAEDIEFTWRYCTDEVTGCTGRSAFSNVAAVEVLDRSTVRVVFDGPTPYPYTAFVGYSAPVISKAQFRACIGAAAAGCEAQNNAPLGTGPYRIVEFRANAEAIYERNPFYRGDAPYFERVTIQGSGDAAEAGRAVLTAGDADYAWNLQLEPQELADLEAGGMGKVATAFGSSVERIVVNQTNPDAALGDDRSEYRDGNNPHPFLTFKPIPQAMSMAIDRAKISEELYGFAGKPACNLIAGPPHYVSTANDGCLAQNLAGARKLLDDNGVLDTDGDGIREYQGVPLRVTYQTSANAVRQKTQDLIQGWWREIGIETKLVQHDASIFFGGDPATDAGATLRRFFADVQMYTGSPGIDPQQNLQAQVCGQIPTRENNWAYSNVARSCNPEYDALFVRLENTRLGPEREAVVKQLNDLLVQNYYQIPLVVRGSVSAHANGLQGVQINAWDSELWNIAEWRR